MTLNFMFVYTHNFFIVLILGKVILQTIEWLDLLFDFPCLNGYRSRQTDQSVSCYKKHHNISHLAAEHDKLNKPCG